MLSEKVLWLYKKCNNNNYSVGFIVYNIITWWDFFNAWAFVIHEWEEYFTSHWSVALYNMHLMQELRQKFGDIMDKFMVTLWFDAAGKIINECQNTVMEKRDRAGSVVKEYIYKFTSETKGNIVVSNNEKVCSKMMSPIASSIPLGHW